MDTTREIIPEIKGVVRRRRLLLIITPVFFLLLSFGALEFIEPKYDSTISILIDDDEAISPQLIYDMGNNPAENNQLEAYDNIIYSRSTIEMLIDSLAYEDSILTINSRKQMVADLRKRIDTDLSVNDTYEITFVDRDPVRARNGARVLGNHFINTKIQRQQRKTSETVEFFTTKLNELEAIVDQQREQVLSSTTDRMRELPIDAGVMQSRLRDIDSQIDELDWRIDQEENRITMLNNFLEQSSEDFNVQSLYRLPMEEIPYGGELSGLLTEYEDLNQQFTESYPRLRTLRSQITEVARRIPATMESNIADRRRQLNDLRTQRDTVIENMEQSFVATQRTNSRQSNIEVYQELYNDMKLKLEQARMEQDISDQAASMLMVIDEPLVAEEPSSPNSTLILGSGLILGIIIGGFFMGIAEALDSTIRSEEDLQFNKPIIAYLSDEKL
ncbi:MAG: Wzz/FepE/Etk N-terminal domain-containing protein [Balneolaceae bacterium]